MIKEVFIGRYPSHFQINPTVRAFIISETIFWSAWNFIMSIFAIFAANNISGGSVEVAATAVSIFLMVRVFFELGSGRFLSNTSNTKKYLATIIGTIIITLAFLGFAYTNSILQLYIFYGLAGIGMGICSPAKNSLFSTHLDKNRETTEWSLYDASVFVGMALSTALGGFIAKIYGFQVLFLVSAIFNFLSIIPYLIYMHKIGRLGQTLNISK